MNLRSIVRLAVGAAVVASASVPSHAQWNANHQLLNLPSETDVKGAEIIASKNGGFHVGYSNANPFQPRYRRWQNGAFTIDRTLPNVFCPNLDVAEAGDGTGHIAWENWDGSSQIGWAKISTSGVVTGPQEISAYGTDGAAKHPSVVAYGPADSSNIAMVSWDAVGKGLWLNRYNGTSWLGNAQGVGGTGNQYAVNSATRSLQDGSVYRAWGVDSSRLEYARWDPNTNTWGPVNLVANAGFVARESIAVNPVGQVMIVWEQDSTMFWRMWTPGVGWSGWTDANHFAGAISSGNFGHVTAVPGTTDFYVVYSRADRVRGKRFSGGGWLAEETVNPNQPATFTPNTHCSAGPDGTIYAAWEYWGNDKPQWYFNIRPGAQGPTGTLQGTVRDQFGAAISNVVVGSGPYSTQTSSNGTYSLVMGVGTYSVTAQKPFYTSQTINNIVISQNQTTNQDFVVQANPPLPPTDVYALPSTNVNRIYWRHSTSGNFVATTIRWKLGSYPTSPTDGTLLVDKTGTAGVLDSHTHSGLINGTTYYYSLFSRDGDGHYSTAVNVASTPAPQSIGDAKMAADGSTVDLNGKIVSAVISAETVIYVQEPNRSAGIRVVPSGGVASFAVGDVVNLSGTIITRQSSAKAAERMISPATVTKTASGSSPKPLSLHNTTFGGEPFGSFQPGVVNGIGLNNMGLLVKVWGKVTSKSGVSMWIDDGSNIPDTSGRVGVFVRFPTGTTITANEGDMVSVVGVITGAIPVGWETNRRSLQARSIADLVILSSPGAGFGTVSGTLLGTGNPVVGGSITLSPGGYQTTSGSGGVYSIANVPNGTYSATATASGFSSQTVNNVVVVTDQTTTVNFNLPGAPGTISGTVRNPQSVGVSGVTVSTNSGGYSTTTGAGGTYSLSGVAPGTYTVSAAISGYTGSSQSNVVVNSNATTTVDLTVTPNPGSISGVVRDSSNIAIAGATVSTTTGGYTTTSGANGAYTLSNVGVGSYTVQASRTGYNSQSKSATVNPGAATTVDFNLTALPGTISGFVRDTNNNAISGATVSTNTGGYATTSAANGSYTLSNVAVGTYNVTASRSGYASQTVNSQSVTPGGTTSVNFNLSVQTFVERLTNGSFEGGQFGFWGGQMSNNWGAAFLPNHGQATTWSVVNMGGSVNNVQRVEVNLQGTGEAGISQQVGGLTPGKQYTFSASAFQSSTNSTAWIAVDPNGGTNLPSKVTAFNNVANQWNTQQVSGTVGAGGTVTVFLWVWHQWNPRGHVSFNNASLMVQQ